MDLYGFISDNVSKPSPKELGQEAGTMQASQFKGAVLANEAEALAALKEEFFNRLFRLENSIAVLKKEQADSDSHASEKAIALSEATALITEKFSEIEQLRSDFSALQKESRETLLKAENAEKGNQTCIAEAERIKKDCAVFMNETKKTALIACILTLIAMVGLFLYFSKCTAGNQNQVSRPVSPSPSPGTPVKAQTAAFADWPRRPINQNVGSFRISLAPLAPEAANKLTAELKDAVAGAYYLYNLEIGPGHGAISQEFLKAPAIDFVNRNGIHAKSADSGSELRIMHMAMSGKQGSIKGTDMFSCIVSIKKEFQPVGILIGGLNKKTRLIAIYA